MADTGSFDGALSEYQNGYNRARTTYTVSWVRDGDNVTFTLKQKGSYAWVYRDGGYYRFIGNNAQYIQLIVNGTQSVAKQSVVKMTYYVASAATTSGWFQNKSFANVSMSVTVPVTGTVTVQVVVSGNGGNSETRTVTFGTASTMDLDGDYYIGSEHTITIKKGTQDLKHTIRYSCGSDSGEIVNMTDDSIISWIPPYSLCRQNTSGISLPITLSLITYMGSAEIGTTEQTRTFIIPENDETRPSLEMALTPVNDFQGFDGIFIQGKSKVSASFTAEGKYGASIGNTYVILDGQAALGNPAVTDVLIKSGDITVSGLVYDSRGITANMADNITILSYTAPTIIPYRNESAIVCERSDSEGTPKTDGEYLRIKCGRKFSRLNDKNKCGIRYRSKAENAGYTAWVTLLSEDSNNDYVSAIIPDVVQFINTGYEIQLQAFDSFGELGTLVFNIGTDDVPLDLGAGGKSVGIGRYADVAADKSLKIAWETWFDEQVHFRFNPFGDSLYPVGSIYLCVNDVSPQEIFGGTWERIKDCFLLAAGDSYESGDVGGEASHTLTEEELPAHSHATPRLPLRNGVNDDVVNYGTNSDLHGWGIYNADQDNNKGWGELYVDESETSEIGGGASHNNMPPYLAVNVWKRIA